MILMLLFAALKVLGIAVALLVLVEIGCELIARLIARVKR